MRILKQRFQLHDTRDERLPQHSWFTERDTLLHGLQVRPQPTDDNIATRYGLPDAIELGTALDRLRDQ